MGRYLDPRNDMPFKRVFGEHPDLLKSFLNALMPFKKGQCIKNLEYIPAELVPDNPTKKNSIVDVRCEDNYGRQFIVEMQMYWRPVFSTRLRVNASKAYVRRMDAGETYTLQQPVYGLAVINDIFDKETSEYYHHYGIINYDNSTEVIKGLEFVAIELPKFKPSTIKEKKMTVLWLRFLNELKHGECDISADLMNNKYIRKAISLCKESTFSTKELNTYEYYWDIIRSEKSLHDDAEQGGMAKGIVKGIAKGREEGLAEGMEKGLAKGREEGLVKGREEGLAEGIEKGIEKGREEGLAEGIEKEREKTVVNSFKSGCSIDFISSIIDLSNDEIIAILQKNNLGK